MAEQIDIQIKTGRLADLPALAEINRSAYAEELVTRIAYPAWPDEVNMLNMFLARLGDRLTDPDSHVCKAIDVVSGKIVGFACWTLQHGAGEKSAYTSPTKKAMQQSTAGLNLKFVTAMAVDAEALATHRKATERYYSLSAFAVSPKYQRRGIGTLLIRHCMDIADKTGTPAWLTALPGSYGLYLRFGFQEVDHRDTDLNAWDDFKCRGFGVYRVYEMVRQPRVVAEDDR